MFEQGRSISLANTPARNKTGRGGGRSREAADSRTPHAMLAPHSSHTENLSRQVALILQTEKTSQWVTSVAMTVKKTTYLN